MMYLNNIYNIINYSSINDIIPLLQYNNWNLFFLNSLDTLNMTSNIRIEYLINYMFDNEKKTYGLELTGYFMLIIIIIIFSFFYSKNNNNFLINKIHKYLEIVWYVSLIYFILSLTINIVNSSSWLANYFNLYNINIFFTSIILFMIIVMFSSLTNNIYVKEVISLETLILMQLVCCFGWSLLNINNFALFIVCLEGFSLTLYILATTDRSFGGVTASIKYFIFGTLGSILLYLGCIMMYELSATTDINFISYNFENKTNLYSNFVLTEEWYSKTIISLNLIIVGLLIKLGAAPLHQWVPDVYSGVPMIITAFYSTVVKIFLFILFLKFAISFITVKEIEYAAILSIIIGCFGALRQVEIKRFLAYGSITHTGYLLIGDLSASYVYLVTYMAATLLFFSILLNINIDGKEITYISDLRFINKSGSLLDRLFLVIILASMAGLPPFAGFYGKMLVWVSLIEDIYLYNDLWSFILLILNFILALIIIFYYMQIMCILFINDEFSNNDKFLNNINYKYNFISILNKNIRLKFIQFFFTIFLTFSIFLIPELYFLI
jgi:NADH-quinone oxidoreductase subunit N